MAKDKSIRVTEAEWADAIRIARIIRHRKHSERYRAIRLFRLALALLDERSVTAEPRP